MGSLNGKVAIVTGASRGIGRATALRLAMQGADVVVTGRTAKDLESLGSELEKTNRKVLLAPGDAASEKAVMDTVERAKKTFGKIDILVNNVGIGAYKPFVDTSVKEYDDMVAAVELVRPAGEDQLVVVVARDA